MSNSVNRRPIVAVEEQLLLREMHMKNSITITPTKQNSLLKSDRKSVEPVRLTPAWEEKNLTNDELNFRGVTMEQAKLETNPPKDRWLVVYFIILIHGIGVLMPWNMFITAKSYYEDYKLGYNYTHVNNTALITNFMPVLTVVSQTPNLIFNWLNIFISFGGSLTSRIVYSIVIEVVIFICTEVLVLVDTSLWPFEFFLITMASVFILNVMNGVYQNTVYGIAARLPIRYTGAVILGNNLSGIFSALIQIISQSISPNRRTAAAYYFIVALFILFICFDTYFILPLTKFYRFHELQYEKAKQKEIAVAKEANIKLRIPYWKIFKKCSPQCFNVFFIFFVTLSIFPSVHSNIKQHHTDFIVPSDYFINITCFLTFSVFATIGNLFSTIVMFPGPKNLHYPVLLRAAFIPLFLLCNYHTDNGRLMTVLIYNEWIYWGIAVVFAFTSGYFSSLAMMYCGKTVAPEHSTTAAMFGAACLVTGIVSGIVVGLIFPYVILFKV